MYISPTLLPNTRICHQPAGQQVIERLFYCISQLHACSIRQIFAWKPVSYGLTGCDRNKGGQAATDFNEWRARISIFHNGFE